MVYLITGGCGFIGSNMAENLLADGHKVIIIDNLSTGHTKNLEDIPNKHNLSLFKGDLLDKAFLNEVFDNKIDFVYHFSANADVRFGLQNPSKDIYQNTLATFNLLEVMKEKKVLQIAFSSTGSVYGEPDVFPTPENAPFPIQTSLYAASKVACEGLISSYSEGFNFKAYIFRFVSILGKKYSHGHIFDFTKSLQQNKKNLKVLGNGLQRKSYLHVLDCIKAMRLAEKKVTDKLSIFNLGTDEIITVNQSIKYICDIMDVKPKLEYKGGDRGWVGDSPLIHLNIDKISKLGWSPDFTIKDSVKFTANWLLNNKWIYEIRN